MGRRGSEPGIWQSCRRAPVQSLASSTIFGEILQFLGKFPDSDPRLPMLQIAKKVVPCSAQELYKMRPEPKKVCTLMRHITLHVTEYMMYMSTRPKFQVQLSVMLLVN